MNRRQSNNNMRCPSCGSMYTQFVPTCFALTRQSGNYYPESNEFHDLIAKPERRSVFVTPMLAGMGAYVAVTIGISILKMESDPSWVRTHSELSPEVMVPALLAGVTCGLVLWLWAWRFNRDIFPGRYDDWSSSAICRRCSTRFRAPERIVSAYRSLS